MLLWHLGPQPGLADRLWGSAEPSPLAGCGLPTSQFDLEWPCESKNMGYPTEPLSIPVSGYKPPSKEVSLESGAEMIHKPQPSPTPSLRGIALTQMKCV